jgi:putative transposase
MSSSPPRAREPAFRDPTLRAELHRFLGGVLNTLECPPIIVGGHVDHVHILCQQSRTRDAASVIKEIKRASSIWLKTKGPTLEEFAWQAGYGVFSVSQSQMDSVRKYIADQEAHHRKLSFQDEYRQFLKKHEVPFDERYLWD